MAWLGRSKSYDRDRLLADATRARKKGRSKKALALLETVLKQEPSNAELHRRVAPLRAEMRRMAEAWTSYRIAVASLVKAGFLDQAVGVLREASVHLGRERAVWEELANTEHQRGRPIDGVEALLEGRKRFRGRRDRPDALRLLQRARELAPTHFEANFDLAGLLGRTGSRAAAARILTELAARAKGSQLRRTRRRQLFLTPSTGALWRLVKSWFGRR
jgi:thioredoxin-like negative regulator of GroEL